MAFSSPNRLMMPIPIVPAAIITSAVGSASVVTAAIVTSTVIPAAVVTIVESVAPIRPVPVVTPVPIAVIGCTVVGPVITGSIKNWDGNREPKGEPNTSARRRFSEDCKSRDNQQEDNELFHNQGIRRSSSGFDQTQ